MKTICIYTRICIFTAVCFLLPVFATTEVFRVHKTIMTKMPESGNTECTAGINDAVVIQLPQDTSFLQAIEIEIKIPEDIAAYWDSVAYSFYTDLQQTPDSTRIDYTGTRMYINTIPGRLSLNLVLPLQENHSLKQNPYSVLLPQMYSLEDKIIFMRFQLVMKGIPESFDKNYFLITVKPVYVDKGRLQLDITYPVDGEQQSIKKPYTVYIDEKQVALENNTGILDTGMHHLSLISDYYRNETRTFSIEQAQTTTLGVQLRDITPTLQFSVPVGTEIFLDENPVSNIDTPFLITQGEHIIRFIVGGYEVVQKLQAVNGRSYIANLSIDIDITESE